MKSATRTIGSGGDSMGNAPNDMKELFTRSFWDRVKKTFDEAREGQPPAQNALQAPAERDPSASSSSETPSSPPVSHAALRR